MATQYRRGTEAISPEAHAEIEQFHKATQAALKITGLESIAEFEQGSFGRWQKLTEQERAALISGKDQAAARKVALKVAGNVDLRSRFIAEFDQSPAAVAKALAKFDIKGW